ALSAWLGSRSLAASACVRLQGSSLQRRCWRCCAPCPGRQRLRERPAGCCGSRLLLVLHHSPVAPLRFVRLGVVGCSGWFVLWRCGLAQAGRWSLGSSMPDPLPAVAVVLPVYWLG